MKEYMISNDPYGLNWIEGETEWGTVKCVQPLQVSVTSEREGDLVRERYCFTNDTDKVIVTSLSDITIATPIHDDYTDAKTCMINRAHTHIWCGGEVSYIMALRMGGEAPHFGMVLTEGSLGGYSVVRDVKQMSNDRGDFFMHVSPMVLSPHETVTVAWTLFPHNGKVDFMETAASLSPKMIEITAEHFVVFEGEPIDVCLKPAFPFEESDVSITVNKRPIAFEICDGMIFIHDIAGAVGENRYDITVAGVHTFCTVYVQCSLPTLTYRRLKFIVEHQQFISDRPETSALDGAFLEYDNEENHVRIVPTRDHNAARERIGMALSLIRYLGLVKGIYTPDETVSEDGFAVKAVQAFYHSIPDEEISVFEKSLDRYLAFMYRELFDSETGETFDDYRRDNTRVRLYNFPWQCLLLTELYTLRKDVKYLIEAARVSLNYYSRGGSHFYAFETPYYKLVTCLRREGQTELADELIGHFREHADFLLERGTNYPAHEVHYEQSIAAPAAELLLQFYRLTGEKKYFDGAWQQIRILDLFNGFQPNWHQNETAIRHWDGYWFGKYKLYGDTYPHYWSALTGNSFMSYFRVMKQTAAADGEIKINAYEKKNAYLRAENSFRGVLPMIFADGRASCAYIYPLSVNGVRANVFDPMANDQDWGLYFMLRFISWSY